MTTEKALEQIEAALFDQDEPGMRDTENGDLIFTEIGVLRLRRIIQQIRKDVRAECKRQQAAWEEANPNRR